MANGADAHHTTGHCPAVATLEDLVEGTLAQTDQQVVDGHVSGCPDCRQVADSLRADRGRGVARSFQIPPAVKQATAMPPRSRPRVRPARVEPGQLWSTKLADPAHATVQRIIYVLDAPHAASSEEEVVHAAPVSARTELATDGDVVLAASESDLGYAVMLRLALSTTIPMKVLREFLVRLPPDLVAALARAHAAMHGLSEGLGTVRIGRPLEAGDDERASALESDLSDMNLLGEDLLRHLDSVESAQEAVETRSMSQAAADDQPQQPFWGGGPVPAEPVLPVLRDAWEALVGALELPLEPILAGAAVRGHTPVGRVDRGDEGAPSVVGLVGGTTLNLQGGAGAGPAGPPASTKAMKVRLGDGTELDLYAHQGCTVLFAYGPGRGAGEHEGAQRIEGLEVVMLDADLNEHRAYTHDGKCEMAIALHSIAYLYTSTLHERRRTELGSWRVMSVPSVGARPVLLRVEQPDGRPAARVRVAMETRGGALESVTDERGYALVGKPPTAA